MPVEQWFRTGLSAELRDLLQSGDATVRRVCNGAEIDRLLGEHLESRHNHEKVLWALANLEQFFRIFRPCLGEAAPAQDREADYLLASTF